MFPISFNLGQEMLEGETRNFPLLSPARLEFFSESKLTFPFSICRTVIMDALLQDMNRGFKKVNKSSEHLHICKIPIKLNVHVYIFQFFSNNIQFCHSTALV